MALPQYFMFRFTYKCTKKRKNGTTDNNKKAWE